MNESDYRYKYKLVVAPMPIRKIHIRNERMYFTSAVHRLSNLLWCVNRKKMEKDLSCYIIALCNLNSNKKTI